MFHQKLTDASCVADASCHNAADAIEAHAIRAKLTAPNAITTDLPDIFVGETYIEAIEGAYGM